MVSIKVLTGKGFTRFVLVSWIICGVAVFVLVNSMDFIVHQRLYDYGLQLSPDWVVPYWTYTWLTYLFLGLPIVLSGIALISSFAKVEKVPQKTCNVPERSKSPPMVVKVESRQINRETAPTTAKKVSSGGISCPHCNKVFGKALVMLDFHNGKNQLVSVCPYCNHVLGTASNAKSMEDFYVGSPNEKITR